MPLPDMHIEATYRRQRAWRLLGPDPEAQLRATVGQGHRLPKALQLLQWRPIYVRLDLLIAHLDETKRLGPMSIAVRLEIPTTVVHRQLIDTNSCTVPMFWYDEWGYFDFMWSKNLNGKIQEVEKRGGNVWL